MSAGETSQNETGTTRPLATDFRRRSPVYQRLRAAGAVFGEFAGGALPVRYKRENEGEQARRLGLADLSVLPRLGFKGRGIRQEMNARGIARDCLPARAFRQPNGMLAAILTKTELLLLSPLAGEARSLAKLSSGEMVAEAEDVYPVPRRDSHFWFMVTGHQAPLMLASLCRIDLRPRALANLVIAQTPIMRNEIIVIRDDRGKTPAYHLLGDSTSALSLWDGVLDAMSAWQGQPIGLRALQALDESRLRSS